MRCMIRSGLSYLYSRKFISGAVILVLALILIFQTYMVENTSEQFRSALSEPFTICLIDASEVDTAELDKVIGKCSGLDVIYTTYVDCPYSDEYGENSEIAVITCLKDFSDKSDPHHIDADLKEALLGDNDLMIYSEYFAYLRSIDLFEDHGDRLCWKLDGKSYDVGMFSSGVWLDVPDLRTRGVMLASGKTYSEISSDEGTDGICICSSPDVTLSDIIRIFGYLKIEKGYGTDISFSDSFITYFLYVLKDCLIIIIGIINLIRIIFFVLDGRKKEFEVLYLCGTTNAGIRAYRLVNIMLYVLPAILFGWLVFTFALPVLWGSDRKFYSISSWQMSFNIILYLVFILAAFLLYERINRRGEYGSV